MGNPKYLRPRTPGATPWRASTLRARVIGALARLTPATREEVTEHTGDPRDQVDHMINALLVEGAIEMVLDRFRLKSPRERLERQVALHDGRVVGSWSQEWNQELEARRILDLPTKQMRAGAILRKREKKGDAAAVALERLITSIYRADKQRGLFG